MRKLFVVTTAAIFLLSAGEVVAEDNCGNKSRDSRPPNFCFMNSNKAQPPVKDVREDDPFRVVMPLSAKGERKIKRSISLWQGGVSKYGDQNMSSSVEAKSKNRGIAIEAKILF
ncbi:MAG: hypothetical protein JWN64_625 [Parcubacteria group bacterium]|nr:hypothetical protein [Parcubacteria group bacterium]